LKFYQSRKTGTDPVTGRQPELQVH
jgi:hypothetical protein